jgi:hypothetical protein
MRHPPIRLAAPPQAPPLLYRASAFTDLLTGGSVTDLAYAGSELGMAPGATRSRVLTAFARLCDTELWHPDSHIEDVTPALCSGSRQKRPALSYDWKRDGERIACKSARLTWDERKRHWKLLFSSIRLPLHAPYVHAFDELLLAVFVPDRVLIFRHDMQAGVSSAGASTTPSGYAISFVGPSGEHRWRHALKVILPKIASGGGLLVSAAFDNPRLQAAMAALPPQRTSQVYAGLPLAGLSGKARGARLSALARRVDEARHAGGGGAAGCGGAAGVGGAAGGGESKNAVEEKENGERGGGGSGWVRGDGRRVAARSAQLLWRSATKNWCFQFRNVPLPLDGVCRPAPRGPASRSTRPPPCPPLSCYAS